MVVFRYWFLLCPVQITWYMGQQFLTCLLHVLLFKYKCFQLMDLECGVCSSLLLGENKLLSIGVP